jgi:alkaline phosphatase
MMRLFYRLPLQQALSLPVQQITRLHLIAAAAVFLLNASCGSSSSVVSFREAPTNVILFIADGAGPAQFTMGRDYAMAIEGRSQLHLDPHQTGSARTASTDSRVTDSAAGATAYSAGIKTYNGAIAVDTLKRPVTTLLEVAEDRGMVTGMVATSRITHATPASFSSHVPDRAMESEIADQQIRQGIEVIVGGGTDYFLPVAEGGLREDARNLLEEARALDYRVVRDLSSFRSLDNVPALALLSGSHLAYEVDRDPLREPDLAEMTRKAIGLLDATGRGFFLLVEGSRIDHASHGNDPVGTLHDVLAYDRAFEEAIEFARTNEETLVIAVADHETGGLSVGRSNPPDIFSRSLDAPTFWRSFEAEDHYGWSPEAIARVANSAEVIAARIRAGADEVALMRELAGIDDLSMEEGAAIRAALAYGDLARVVGEIVSRRAAIGWTTGGHTAVDVGLYAFGPGSYLFRGSMENDRVGRLLLDLLQEP